MKKNIAIVTGGNSGEYEISVKSAAVVKNNLDTKLYNGYVIIIKGQDWDYIHPAGEKYTVDKNDFSLDLPEGKMHFDCVFIIIHGTPGEDGMLQGYFDLLGIPYTSCNMVTSAITFNKCFCKRLVKTFGIKTASSYITRDIYLSDEILQRIEFPCFVKPNKGGSSVGVTKVMSGEELEPAIRKALTEDDEAVIEEFIPGREITCGVIKKEKKIISLPVTEIISRKEFFDYEAKYTDGMAKEITPALIPENIKFQCQDNSVNLYRSLGCKGFVRFDYIYNDEGMYFLEVNTVPGLAKNSIIPQQAREAGISLSQLFTITINEALHG